jgi:hypothetical protein
MDYIRISVLFVIALFFLVWFIDHEHQCKKKHILTHNTVENKQKSLLPVLDPVFNMRSICKQSTLLEEHLSIERLRCDDCCKKHFLMIEGLAEEAISLDKNGKYLHMLEPLPDKIRRLQDMYNEGEDYHKIAQGLREIRKSLIHHCFNMGGSLGLNNDGSLPTNSKTCGATGSTCGGGGGGGGVGEGGGEVMEKCSGRPPVDVQFNSGENVAQDPEFETEYGSVSMMQNYMFPSIALNARKLSGRVQLG